MANEETGSLRQGYQINSAPIAGTLALPDCECGPCSAKYVGRMSRDWDRETRAADREYRGF